MERTPGQAFYSRHLAFLEAGDLDGLVTQYSRDATIVGFDFTVEGHEAIRTFFENYFARLGFFKLKATDKFKEIEDAIFFEATITSRLGEARVYDVFLLRNGKATHQFAGVMSASPPTQGPG